MQEIIRCLLVILWIVAASYFAFNKNYTILFKKKEIHNTASRFIFMVFFVPLLLMSIAFVVGLVGLMCLVLFSILYWITGYIV
jgi:hypothetical protein